MQKNKILIVDDEEVFTKMVKLNLETTGEFEVKTENNGAQALNIARSYKPDLILLDIVMPDKDGSEVAKELKSDRLTRDIPIVFLTAIVRKDEITAKDGIIGGYPFISKPVNTEELVRGIKKYIEK